MFWLHWTSEHIAFNSASELYGSILIALRLFRQKRVEMCGILRKYEEKTAKIREKDENIS